MLPMFTGIVKELLDRQVLLTSRIIPGGEHCEACWEEQVPFFINTLMYQHY